MAHFLVLARGESIASARVVCVSADQGLVDKFLLELAGVDEDADVKHDEREPLRVVRGDDEE